MTSGSVHVRVWCLLVGLLLLWGFSVQTGQEPPPDGSLTLEVRIDATGEEADQGYFELKTFEKLMLVTEPKRRLHQWFRSRLYSEVILTLKPKKPKPTSTSH